MGQVVAMGVRSIKASADEQQLFDRIESQAREAVAVIDVSPTKASIFALAEYVDLVKAGLVCKDKQLYSACILRIKTFIAEHVEEHDMVNFWERSDEMFRLYRRHLNELEQGYQQARKLA